MNKLDEIETRYSSEGEIEFIQIADDLGLLVRAVRQLGAAYLDYRKHVWSADEPDPDVLDLIQGSDR